MPRGTTMYHLETAPGKGGNLGRAPGSVITLLDRKVGKGGKVQVVVEMPSGGEILRSEDCMGLVGMPEGQNCYSVVEGKAGRKRWQGRRPHVRGVAMNPVDHPHGGGEGKTSGGGPSVTPWGRITRGQPTRRRNKVSPGLQSLAREHVFSGRKKPKEKKRREKGGK